MTRLLDAYADVLPYGLHPTPFGEVWRALQAVASTVWDVDPAVYRAGIAWGWYAQHNPDALNAQRDLVIAALISEQAPLIKADQTTEELVEYLRQWREYRPTYDRLEALYRLFAADVEILPVSTPGGPPAGDTRLAFYVRIYGVDFSRLLTLEEAYTIAIRATPLGSCPIVYYEFDEQLSVDTQPLKAGIASINYKNDAICEPVELNHYTFIVADATTGQIVSGFSNELVYGDIEGIVLQSPKLVYGVDISVPTAQFWFTQNGRDETENTVLQPNSTVTVYDENGDTISDEDTIGMYDTASVLSYMQANGDMISKQDDVLIDDNGELGLQVDSGPISAWSVFAERVFTLSFANTQLPDITITMPADETGHKGTSITLPTMTGEYESGGKTWKPSSWDIGAFGDSYTLNADTVAHLIFEEVEAQEIDIDVNFGDPVTIPAGYSVQSVKSSTAYAFAQNATANYGALYFTVPGKNYYFFEKDKSLLGYKINPCLQLYQYGSDNSGYWLTSTSSQSPGMTITPDTAYCVLNGTSSGVSVMLYFYATGPSSVSSIATAINGGKYALRMRRYDSNEELVSYHFKVPMVIWRYIDGVFSWQGDTTATKSLAYWYTKIASTNTFRIHCVKGTLPSLYKIGWFAANKSDVYLSTGSEYTLYDENGARIPYDSSKSYTFLWCVRGETTDVSIPASGFRTLYMTDQSGYLRFGSEASGYTVGLASHIYYVET